MTTVRHVRLQESVEAQETVDHRSVVEAMSFDAIRSAIDGAVQKDLPRPSNAYVSGPWVRDVYDDYCIVQDGDEMYRYDYVLDPASGDVTLSGKRQVVEQKTYSPVTETDLRRKMAAQVGHAMPDGKYVVQDRPGLQSAVRSFDNYTGDKDALQAHLINRAAALSSMDLLPMEWSIDFSAIADEAPIQEAAFSAKQRKALVDKGEAMPDGSYPTPTKASLSDAFQGFGRYAGDKNALKAYLVRRAKALGAEDMIPEDWKTKEANDPAKSFILSEASPGTDDKTSNFEVLVIQPGLSKNRRRYTPEVLQEATPRLDGAKSFASDGPDHDPRKRGVKALVGWWSDPLYRDDIALPNGHVAEGLTATYHVTDDDLAKTLRRSLDGGKPDLIGFSIVADGDIRVTREASGMVDLVTRIKTFDSVDPVLHAAAGGTAIRLVASMEPEMDWANLTKALALKGLLEGTFTVADLKENREDLFNEINALTEAAPGTTTIDPGQAPGPASNPGGTTGWTPTQEPKGTKPSLVEAEPSPADQALIRRLDEMETQGRVRAALDKRPKLDKAVKARIQEACEGQVMTEAQVEDVVKREVAYFASLVKTNISESGEVTDITDVKGERDRVVEHIYDMLTGKDQGSLRGLYVDLTGDREMKGKMQESGRLSESITTTTFADVMQDAMHKRLLDVYNIPGLQNWTVVANTVPINDFRDRHLLRMGGYGDLPIVAQGGPYTALSSPGDEVGADYTPNKRGGLEDLTFETIINDDLGALRRIPVALGRSAAQTLNEFVLDMVAQNQNVGDGRALFHSAHKNIGTAILSSPSLIAGRLAMKKQTEPGSGKRIGITPKFLLIPDNLEGVAYNILVQPAAATAVDFVRTFGLTVVPVSYWLDTNNWFLAADKAQYELVEVGFLNGQQDPELYVQDQPTVGNVFSNDKITYKIRHIYGGAVVDYRAFYGSIVSGS